MTLAVAMSVESLPSKHHSKTAWKYACWLVKAMPGGVDVATENALTWSQMRRRERNMYSSYTSGLSLLNDSLGASSQASMEVASHASDIDHDDNDPGNYEDAFEKGLTCDSEEDIFFCSSSRVGILGKNGKIKTKFPKPLKHFLMAPDCEGLVSSRNGAFVGGVLMNSLDVFVWHRRTNSILVLGHPRDESLLPRKQDSYFSWRKLYDKEEEPGKTPILTISDDGKSIVMVLPLSSRVYVWVPPPGSVSFPTTILNSMILPEHDYWYCVTPQAETPMPDSSETQPGSALDVSFRTSFVRSSNRCVGVFVFIRDEDIFVTSFQLDIDARPIHSPDHSPFGVLWSTNCITGGFDTVGVSSTMRLLVRWDPFGQILAVALSPPIEKYDESSRILFMAPIARKVIPVRLPDHKVLISETVSDMAWSHDGLLLAVVYCRGTIILLNRVGEIIYLSNSVNLCSSPSWHFSILPPNGRNAVMISQRGGPIFSVRMHPARHSFVVCNGYDIVTVGLPTGLDYATIIRSIILGSGTINGISVFDIDKKNETATNLTSLLCAWKLGVAYPLGVLPPSMLNAMQQLVTALSTADYFHVLPHEASLSLPKPAHSVTQFSALLALGSFKCAINSLWLNHLHGHAIPWAISLTKDILLLLLHLGYADAALMLLREAELTLSAAYSWHTGDEPCSMLMPKHFKLASRWQIESNTCKHSKLYLSGLWLVLINYCQKVLQREEISPHVNFSSPAVLATLRGVLRVAERTVAARWNRSNDHSNKTIKPTSDFNIPMLTRELDEKDYRNLTNIEQIPHLALSLLSYRLHDALQQVFSWILVIGDTRNITSNFSNSLKWSTDPLTANYPIVWIRHSSTDKESTSVGCNLVRSLARFMAAYFSDEPICIRPPSSVSSDIDIVPAPRNISVNDKFLMKKRTIALQRRRVTKVVQMAQLTSDWTPSCSVILFLVSGEVMEAIDFAHKLGDWKCALMIAAAHRGIIPAAAASVESLLSEQLTIAQKSNDPSAFVESLSGSLLSGAVSLVDKTIGDSFLVMLAAVRRAQLAVPHTIYLPYPPCYCPQPSKSSSELTIDSSTACYPPLDGSLVVESKSSIFSVLSANAAEYPMRSEIALLAQRILAGFLLTERLEIVIIRYCKEVLDGVYSSSGRGLWGKSSFISAAKGIVTDMSSRFDKNNCAEDCEVALWHRFIRLVWCLEVRDQVSMHGRNFRTTLATRGIRAAEEAAAVAAHWAVKLLQFDDIFDLITLQDTALTYLSEMRSGKELADLLALHLRKNDINFVLHGKISRIITRLQRERPDMATRLELNSMHFSMIRSTNASVDINDSKNVSQQDDLLNPASSLILGRENWEFEVDPDFVSFLHTFISIATSDATRDDIIGPNPTVVPRAVATAIASDSSLNINNLTVLQEWNNGSDRSQRSWAVRKKNASKTIDEDVVRGPIMKLSVPLVLVINSFKLIESNAFAQPSSSLTSPLSSPVLSSRVLSPASLMDTSDVFSLSVLSQQNDDHIDSFNSDISTMQISITSARHGYNENDTHNLDRLSVNEDILSLSISSISSGCSDDDAIFSELNRQQSNVSPFPITREPFVVSSISSISDKNSSNNLFHRMRASWSVNMNTDTVTHSSVVAESTPLRLKQSEEKLSSCEVSPLMWKELSPDWHSDNDTVSIDPDNSPNITSTIDVDNLDTKGNITNTTYLDRFSVHEREEILRWRDDTQRSRLNSSPEKRYPSPTPHRISRRSTVDSACLGELTSEERQAILRWRHGVPFYADPQKNVFNSVSQIAYPRSPPPEISRGSTERLVTAVTTAVADVMARHIPPQRVSSVSTGPLQEPKSSSEVIPQEYLSPGSSSLSSKVAPSKLYLPAVLEDLAQNFDSTVKSELSERGVSNSTVVFSATKTADCNQQASSQRAHGPQGLFLLSGSDAGAVQENVDTIGQAQSSRLNIPLLGDQSVAQPGSTKKSGQSKDVPMLLLPEYRSTSSESIQRLPGSFGNRFNSENNDGPSLVKLPLQQRSQEVCGPLLKLEKTKNEEEYHPHFVVAHREARYSPPPPLVLRLRPRRIGIQKEANCWPDSTKIETIEGANEKISSPIEPIMIDVGTACSVDVPAVIPNPTTVHVATETDISSVIVEPCSVDDRACGSSWKPCHDVEFYVDPFCHSNETEASNNIPDISSSIVPNDDHVVGSDVLSFMDDHSETSRPISHIVPPNIITHQQYHYSNRKCNTPASHAFLSVTDLDMSLQHESCGVTNALSREGDVSIFGSHIESVSVEDEQHSQFIDPERQHEMASISLLTNEKKMSSSTNLELDSRESSRKKYSVKSYFRDNHLENVPYVQDWPLSSCENRSSQICDDEVISPLSYQVSVSNGNGVSEISLDGIEEASNVQGLLRQLGLVNDSGEDTELLQNGNSVWKDLAEVFRGASITSEEPKVKKLNCSETGDLIMESEHVASVEIDAGARSNEAPSPVPSQLNRGETGDLIMESEHVASVEMDTSAGINQAPSPVPSQLLFSGRDSIGSSPSESNRICKRNEIDITVATSKPTKTKRLGSESNLVYCRRNKTDISEATSKPMKAKHLDPNERSRRRVMDDMQLWITREDQNFEESIDQVLHKSSDTDLDEAISIARQVINGNEKKIAKKVSLKRDEKEGPVSGTLKSKLQKQFLNLYHAEKSKPTTVEDSHSNVTDLSEHRRSDSPFEFSRTRKQKQVNNSNRSISIAEDVTNKPPQGTTGTHNNPSKQQGRSTLLVASHRRNARKRKKMLDSHVEVRVGTAFNLLQDLVNNNHADGPKHNFRYRS